MKLFESKKGFATLLLNPYVLILLAIMAVILFGGTTLLVWILSKSLLMIIGVLVLLGATLAMVLFKAVPPWWVWAIGALLTLLSYIPQLVASF